MNENINFMLPDNTPPAFIIKEIVHTAIETHVYISTEIGEPWEYIDLIHTLNMANPDDVILIHINTPGGNLDTGIQLCNAMKNCQAEVVTILEGQGFSLGSLLFLSGHRKIAQSNSMLMIHNVSSGIIGKGHEMRQQINATEKWFSKLARDIYIPFLSEDEFTRILDGEDFYILSEEVQERLNRMEQELEPTEDYE